MQEGPRSGSLTMTRKMKTNYNVDPVPAKENSFITSACNYNGVVFVHNTQIRDRSEKDKSQLKIHWTESMTQLKNRDLLIMKDDNLIPEQRKETGQLRHHRSTSYTKGMQIHDRAHGKESGWTNISFNRQKRHKLPRAQIGESGRCG
ncbi:uncharacterized protein [Malus domestica]|uniref:uncharacterized protein n=1 Tax=Malus domestica TaxID=3750 RepID=UPI00397721C9